MKTFATAGDDRRLQSPHAVGLLRFHLVLAAWRRQGVFGLRAAQAIADTWRSLESDHRFALLKVSFVPDHAHVAVRVHPTVAPGLLGVALMNAAQRTMWRDFASDVIQARAERLWQPSAYIGSFGDLATPQIVAYLRRWRAQQSS